MASFQTQGGGFIRAWLPSGGRISFHSLALQEPESQYSSLWVFFSMDNVFLHPYLAGIFSGQRALIMTGVWSGTVEKSEGHMWRHLKSKTSVSQSAWRASERWHVPVFFCTPEMWVNGDYVALHRRSKVPKNFLNNVFQCVSRLGAVSSLDIDVNCSCIIEVESCIGPFGGKRYTKLCQSKSKADAW